MENEYRSKQRKSYNLMRMTKDLTMAGLILAMAVLMLVGNRLGNRSISEFVGNLDPTMRYLFGGLCLLYGGFRLYRAFASKELAR